MKKHLLIASFALFLNAGTVLGQDIPQNQVPSLVVNNFQQRFPKALDVEWELEQGLYKAEFETGLLRTDHDAWYDKTGKLVRHKEEISQSDLPKKITAKISKDFSGYRADDVKKITEGGKVTYTLELKSSAQEWKVAFDTEGTILSKVAD